MREHILSDTELGWFNNSRVDPGPFLNSGPRVEWLERVVNDLSKTLGKEILPINPGMIDYYRGRYGLIDFDLCLPWGESMLFESGFRKKGVNVIKTACPTLPLHTFAIYYEKFKSLRFNEPFVPVSDMEVEVHEQMTAFKARIDDYAVARTLLSSKGTSNLSPYLALGVLSFEQVMTFFAGFKDNEFYRQLSWIGYCRLKAPKITPWAPDKNLYDCLGRMESWISGDVEPSLRDWFCGQKKLLDQGSLLSNRSRLILSAYLIRDLRIPWQLGALWFRVTLKDSHPLVNEYNWYSQSKNRFLKNYNILSQLKRFEG